MSQLVYYILHFDPPADLEMHEYSAIIYSCSGDNVSRLYHTASKVSSRFAIELAEPVDPVAVQSFFFLPNYCVNAGTPLVFTRSADLSAVESIEASARQQGFHGLKMVRLTNDFMTGPIQFIESIKRRDASSVTAFFVQVRSIDELHQCEQAIKQAVANGTGGSAEWQMILDLQKKSALLEAANQEIKNLEQHNETLRLNSHSSELQRYYNHEYEILPTWYKKLGHLIKIITGKRSAKALVNRGAKKYKD